MLSDLVSRFTDVTAILGAICFILGFLTRYIYDFFRDKRNHLMAIERTELHHFREVAEPIHVFLIEERRALVKKKVCWQMKQKDIDALIYRCPKNIKIEMEQAIKEYLERVDRKHYITGFGNGGYKNCDDLIKAHDKLIELTK